MKHSCLLFVLLGSLSFSAQAQRAWLLPSATVLSGSEPWVTLDAAVSNDLFFLNNKALPLQGLTVTAPDGRQAEPEHLVSSRLRSSFDVHLVQPGTWKIALLQNTPATNPLPSSPLPSSPPTSSPPTSSPLPGNPPPSSVPGQARDTQLRVETYITLGQPTTHVMQLAGQGLEIVPVTHPADLVSGESAQFSVWLDGQPLANAEVEVVRGGVRYQDRAYAVAFASDRQGLIRVRWPGPGMYWLRVVKQPAALDITSGAPVLITSLTVEVAAR